MADYDSRDGSFTVPGREGYGIPPGKYRIAIVETFRRETLDKLRKPQSRRADQVVSIKTQNFLEESFGETTSPFVRDLKTSTKLTLDMSKPNG